MAGRADAPRDLLFGLLALQNGLIQQATLVAAFQAWTLSKDRPMAEILVEQGALDPADRAILEPLVARHIQMHGGDAEKSLAELNAGSSTRESLAKIGDPDIDAALVAVFSHSTEIGDVDQTASYAVGSATRDGRRFRILRPHAKGGLGAVFVALDEELHREVALKQIQDELADDPVSRQRFIREAEVTSGLEHPGIVPVYGLGSYADGRPYYAMRFIRGNSLKEAIAGFHANESLKRDPGLRSLELRKLLQRFLDVCNTIEYAHQRGVLHRDLKPGNIMVGRYGETLVVDWGLAKAEVKAERGLAFEERTLVPSLSSGSAETLPGSAIGTPAYMSPEQAVGDLNALGPRSDVYSLGATLYCLLTGKPPFEGGDAGAVLQAVGKGDFPPPRRIDPTLDRALEAVCLKAMAVTPEARYGSPRALADDVERWAADEPVTAYHDSLRTRLARWGRRHRAWVQVGVGALILLSVVSTVATFLVNQARRGEMTQRRITAEALVKVDQQRKVAEEQTLEARQQTANLAFAQALSMCEQGDIGRGMLWMAHSLEITPPQSVGLQNLIRINLVNWSRQLNSILNICWYEEPTHKMAISPDGNKVATTHNAVVQIRDAVTGRPMGAPLKHQDTIWGVSFSPDGRMVATGSVDGTARVWDSATGRPLGPPLIHHGNVAVVAFSPDGKTLLTGTAVSDRGVLKDGKVRSWDPITSEHKGILVEHSGSIGSIAFRGDGKAIVIGFGDKSARAWDMSTRQPIGPALIHQGWVPAVAFSPDGKTVATGDVTGIVRVWDASTGQPIGPPLTHGTWINTVAFRHDGEAIVTGSSDGTARVWDARTGRPIGQPLTHRGGVLAVGFRPDGRTLLTCSGGTHSGDFVLWATTTDAPVSFPVPQSFRSRVAIRPDGRAVAIGSGRNGVTVWDTATEKPMGPYVVHQGRELWNVAISPDGTAILTAGSGVAQVWDVATGRPIGPALKGYFSPNGSACFSPDGKAIASCTESTAQVWDAATGRPIGIPLGHRWTIRAIGFTPDGRAVAIDSSPDKMARMLDLTSGRPLGPPLQTKDGIHAVAFSPGGRVAMTASGSTARLWDMSTGRPVGPTLRHLKTIYALAFSPDGNAIVTGSQDSTARVWDAATGRPLGPPLFHEKEVVAVAFRSDGKSVQTVNSGSTQCWTTGLPVEDESERIVLWCQSVTGMQLDNRGGTNMLDPNAWEVIHRRLDELGGTLHPITKTSELLSNWHNWEITKGVIGSRFSTVWHSNKLLDTGSNPNLYVRRGDYYHSVGLTDKAVTEFELAIQHGIANSHIGRRLVDSYYELYEKARVENLLAKALDCLKQAEKHSESVTNPEASDYYNLACVRSLVSALIGADTHESSPDNLSVRRKYADNAMAALQLAIKSGYNDYSHMNQDTDLDPLRSRPDFQLLMMDITFPGDPFAR